MFRKFDLVSLASWDDAYGFGEGKLVISGPWRVTDTFYEPGDPVQGVNLISCATGERRGGIDSQDCSPWK